MIEIATAALQDALAAPARLLRAKNLDATPRTLHLAASADRGAVFTASDGTLTLETCVAPGGDLVVEEPGDVFLPPDVAALIAKAKAIPRARLEADGRMLDIALPPTSAQVSASFALPTRCATPQSALPGDAEPLRVATASLRLVAPALALFRHAAPRDIFAIVAIRKGLIHACDGMVYVRRVTDLPDLLLSLRAADALVALAQTADAAQVAIYRTPIVDLFDFGQTRLTVPHPLQQPVDAAIYKPDPHTLIQPPIAVDRAALGAALDRVRLAATAQALVLTAQQGTLTLRCDSSSVRISEDMPVVFPGVDPVSATVSDSALRVALDACAPAAAVAVQFTRPRLRRPSPIVIAATNAATVATIQQLRSSGGAR